MSARRIDRTVVSALVDRLIFGDTTTFDRADAEALVRELDGAPRLSWWRALFHVSARVQTTSTSAAGYSPGAGNVRLEERRDWEFDSNGRAILRAGQWKLCRRRSAIEIEQMMGDDEDRKAALLELRRGQPTQLLLRRTRWLKLGPIGIGISGCDEWKVPA